VSRPLNLDKLDQEGFTPVDTRPSHIFMRIKLFHSCWIHVVVVFVTTRESGILQHIFIHPGGSFFVLRRHDWLNFNWLQTGLMIHIEECSESTDSFVGTFPVGFLE
jgi:hypothetical protein